MYLVIGPIIEDPKIELLYAFLFIVGGLVFYFPLVVFKLDRGCFGRYHVKQNITSLSSVWCFTLFVVQCPCSQSIDSMQTVCS